MITGPALDKLPKLPLANIINFLEETDKHRLSMVCKRLKLISEDNFAWKECIQKRKLVIKEGFTYKNIVKTHLKIFTSSINRYFPELNIKNEKDVFNTYDFLQSKFRNESKKLNDAILNEIEKSINKPSKLEEEANIVMLMEAGAKPTEEILLTAVFHGISAKTIKKIISSECLPTTSILNTATFTNCDSKVIKVLINAGATPDKNTSLFARMHYPEEIINLLQYKDK